VLRKTRGKDYFQYLVRWKNWPEEDDTWITKNEVSKYGIDVEDLMNNYFLLRESDAGAST